MIIRKATLADLSEVLRLAQLVKLGFKGFYWHRYREVRYQICRRRYYVAMSGQRIVGILNLFPGRHAMDINLISVDSCYQGRGIGAKLVEFALDLAQQKNKKTLAVSSFKVYRVKEFYLHLGFKLIGEGSFCKQPYWNFSMSI